MDNSVIQLTRNRGKHRQCSGPGAVYIVFGSGSEIILTDLGPSIIKKIPVFKQTTISTVFCDLLSLKTDINVPTGRIKKNKLGKSSFLLTS